MHHLSGTTFEKRREVYLILAKLVRMSAVAAGALVVAAQVNAADIYGGWGYKDAPMVIATTWTGFYVGAHVGGAWADMQTTDIRGWDYPYTIGDKWNNVSTGVIGGGQVGYNYQTGAFVFGVEADFGGIGLSHNTTPYGGYVDYFSSIKDGFYTDVTGRLGYAAGPALFYVKGGWAYYDGAVSITDNFGMLWGFCTGFSTCHASASGLSGWTLGGGIEYKMSPSWSVKGEYRYFDFGSVTTNWVDVYAAPWSFKHQLTADAVTVGVNYSFGGCCGHTPLK